MYSEIHIKFTFGSKKFLHLEEQMVKGNCTSRLRQLRQSLEVQPDGTRYLKPDAFEFVPSFPS